MLHHFDQTLEAPTFQSPVVALQYAEGLLSPIEAAIFDVLDVQGLFAPLVIQQIAGDYHHAHPLLQAQIHLRCYEDALPWLHQWCSQFLARRQLDLVVILGTTVTSGEPGVVPYEERGLLIIGSSLQDMHGTLAVRVAEHLFEEGQITSYSLYGTGDLATRLLQTL